MSGCAVLAVGGAVVLMLAHVNLLPYWLVLVFSLFLCGVETETSLIQQLSVHVSTLEAFKNAASSPPFCPAEHGAGHRLLPESPRHEPAGVPHVVLLLLVFLLTRSQPRVGLAAHPARRHSEAALPRRQTPQGHQRAGGDGEDLRQSQYIPR